MYLLIKHLVKPMEKDSQHRNCELHLCDKSPKLKIGSSGFQFQLHQVGAVFSLLENVNKVFCLALVIGLLWEVNTIRNVKTHFI